MMAGWDFPAPTGGTDVNITQIAGVTADSSGGGRQRISITDTSGNALSSAIATTLALTISSQSGIAAALVTAPGFWTVSSTPAAGTQASASKAAGGAAVRHIGMAMDYGYGATTALAAAAQRLVNWRDGATGAGTVLLALSVPVPAATILATNNDATETRGYPGTAATAMTAEWDAAQANLFQGAAVSGYDAS